MELKQYQRNVLSDLQEYLALLYERQDLTAAFADFWMSKGVPVGAGLFPPYKNVIPGVPNVCFKVPTGGGKTFMAACSIKPILDSMPRLPYKVVVWLVPSDSIMEQTLSALRNPDHPYRQRINQDFGHRVEVYTKEQVKVGQNFNPAALQGQLSIIVLSYDSFRTNKAEGRIAYRENGYLKPFENALGEIVKPIEDAEELSVFQVINQMMPLVIVDESHHAKGALSIRMLKDFNPCFVLDLTATPTEDSNVLSFVEAGQLKKEHMVKLPVIVYNRKDLSEVLRTARELRGNLENDALAQQKNGGRYIRPIVLFQAQPRGGDERATFEKIRERLIKNGIPADEIAIKTAEINELRNLDLLSPECKIRYIITINALKEGWDCPFAYVLASLANRSSLVEVEQILGRVLRQPYAQASTKPLLNISYVITSSDDFFLTINQVIAGLKSAGFSAEDYRRGGNDLIEEASHKHPDAQDTQEDFLNLFQTEHEDSTEGDKGTDLPGNQITGLQEMMTEAIRQAEEYERKVVEQTGKKEPGIPQVIQNIIPQYSIEPSFREQAEMMRLPQFFFKTEQSVFSEEQRTLHEKEHLNEGFTLIGKSYAIPFDSIDEQIYKVDLEGNKPVFSKLYGLEISSFLELFSKLSPEKQADKCRRELKERLWNIDSVSQADIFKYIDLIVDSLSGERLSTLAKSLDGAAEKIRGQIDVFLIEHRMEQFKKWMDQGRVLCEPSYQFPSSMFLTNAISNIAKALYEGESDMNPLERRVVESLASLPNIIWWHRNPSTPRTGFRLNGFINHYPDIIVYTKRKHLLLIETKGEHLNNPDSMQKLKLGAYWQSKAGEGYRYFMVYENNCPKEDHAYNLDEFFRMAEGL